VRDAVAMVRQAQGNHTSETSRSVDRLCTVGMVNWCSSIMGSGLCRIY
jgi:hypothetical protein